MKFRIIALCLILAGCGPSFHLRRANYHLKKAELKGALIKPDTVFVEKKVFIPEVQTDTIFESKEGDTVFISKDRLKLKYVNLPGDSVFIEGKCESDTVTVTVPITITKNITAPKGFWYYFPWLLFVLALAAVAYFIRSFKKTG
jgi:hypothetical protein